MGIKKATVDRFKQICKDKDISPNKLANLAGVTPSTVYSFFDYEREDVSLITVKILCDALDMTMGEFYNTKEFDELGQEIK